MKAHQGGSIASDCGLPASRLIRAPGNLQLHAQRSQGALYSLILAKEIKPSCALRASRDLALTY
jgi:hypothetical protein